MLIMGCSNSSDKLQQMVVFQRSYTIGTLKNVRKSEPVGKEKPPKTQKE